MAVGNTCTSSWWTSTSQVAVHLRHRHARPHHRRRLSELDVSSLASLTHPSPSSTMASLVMFPSRTDAFKNYRPSSNAHTDILTSSSRASAGKVVTLNVHRKSMLSPPAAYT